MPDSLQLKRSLRVHGKSGSLKTFLRIICATEVARKSAKKEGTAWNAETPMARTLMEICIGILEPSPAAVARSKQAAKSVEHGAPEG